MLDVVAVDVADALGVVHDPAPAAARGDAVSAALGGAVGWPAPKPVMADTLAFKRVLQPPAASSHEKLLVSDSAMLRKTSQHVERASVPSCYRSLASLQAGSPACRPSPASSPTRRLHRLRS